MFDTNTLPESKYVNGMIYDLDCDTANGGRGLTPSQAEAKKEYYKQMGYWCRAIVSEGRFMFYILAKDIVEDTRKVNDYIKGRRKTPPVIKSSTPRKSKK